MNATNTPATLTSAPILIAESVGPGPIAAVAKGSHLLGHFGLLVAAVSVVANNGHLQ